MKIAPDIQRHLDAAEGWLGLGLWSEAHAELDCIALECRNAPEVLEMRYQIDLRAERWQDAATIAESAAAMYPDRSEFHRHWAYALHRLGRTEEGLKVLVKVAERFPNCHVIAFNIAMLKGALSNGESGKKESWKAIAIIPMSFTRSPWRRPRPLWRRCLPLGLSGEIEP